MRIAKESLPFASVLLVAAVLAWVVVSPWLAVPFVLLLLFTLWFFRDPERHAPNEPDALISPADGRIIQAGPDRISIFMNVFNVHVCRAPSAGRVDTVHHVPGSFVSAFKDHASTHNERTRILLVDGPRELEMTLVAGLIARRIVCKITPGQQLSRGERVGLIRFGSRVDLALPPGATAAVEVGSRVVAGETIVARLRPAPGAAPPAPR